MAIEEKVKIVDEASSPLKKIGDEAQKTSGYFEKLRNSLKFNDPKLEKSLAGLKGRFKEGITGAQQELGKAFPNLNSTVTHLGGVYKSLAGINPVIAAGVVAIGGYAAALKGYFKLTQEYSDDYKEQMQAETGLAQVSINRRGTGDISEYTTQASAIQNKGILGDDALLGGSKNLMMAGNIKEALSMQNTLADMAVASKGYDATAGDVEQAAMAINRALGGQTRGLMQYGIVLNTAEAKLYAKMKTEERSAFLQDKLAKSIGGFNETFAKGGLGIKKNFENALGDLKDNVGKYVVSAIGGIYGVFKKHIGFFSKIADIAGPVLNMLGEGLASFGDILLGVGEGIFDVVSSIITPVFNLLTAIGEFIGLGDTFTEQISKVARVIGVLGSGIGTVISELIEIVTDGFGQLTDSLLWGINTLFAKAASVLPDYITSEVDFLKNAQGNADKYFQKIQERGQKGIFSDLGDTVYNMMSDITDIMHGTTGKPESFNLLENIRKILAGIGNDTSSIDKKVGKNDEDYIQSIKDYILNRNQYYNNSNVDSRQYNVQLSKNNLRLIDETGHLGDLLI